MRRDFNENLKAHFTNLRESAFQELSRENYSFMELEELEKRLYEKMEGVIKHLPEEHKKAINEFLDAEGMVSSQRCEHMYYCGMRDGIRLLKFLQVL